MADFDEYAGSYEEQLQKGVSLSGEDSSYFIEGRIDHLKKLLAGKITAGCDVLDFGCGVGGACPVLHDAFSAATVIGADVSEEAVARAAVEHPDACFMTCDQLYESDCRADLIYCNGVFHHIPPAERAAVLAKVASNLKPGGYFALFENNPWSLATRWVMHRIPFDRDAVMVWPSQARKLLINAEFEIVTTRFYFIFPKSLSAFRALERPVERLPFGAQYLVIARFLGDV